MTVTVELEILVYYVVLVRNKRNCLLLHQMVIEIVACPRYTFLQHSYVTKITPNHYRLYLIYEAIRVRFSVESVQLTC